jgi:hypothetical protein
LIEDFLDWACSLCRAVAATELPSGIKIEELNWPMPAMVLGFPQRFMLEYLGLAGN